MSNNYSTSAQPYSSKQDQEQGLSLTGVNAAVVRLLVVEVTARMLHGETPSDAMQSGFDDVQQAYLDTADLPGSTSEDRATAANLIERIPSLSSSVKISAKLNATKASELEDFILSLERETVDNKMSRGGVVNVPTTDDCFGIYMSYIDSELPIFPVLFDPLSRDNRPAASCLYFDSSVDLAAYIGRLMSNLSDVNFNSVYPLEALTLESNGTTGLDSQHLVECEDLIEALGWPRPEPVPMVDDDDKHWAEEEAPEDTRASEVTPEGQREEAITPVKEEIVAEFETPETEAPSEEDQQQHSPVKGRPFRLVEATGDVDLPSEELPDFTLLPPEPIIEGEENNQFCGFCGFDWRRELAPLQRFFGEQARH
ncbi:hypothetical protein FOL47_002902 [Perkinsus chesapeaki]|uniref:Uncharacterized protein n=1 Tax=Perkinsus chesapeaki TaxID=330153 RepID=A0A7J6MBG2_PERCH|nr:hypothetical protein FOL47_002902 [Perkinsus chesapeaki]